MLRHFAAYIALGLMMALRDRLFECFHRVGTGTLRLSPEVADEFASHIANAHDGIYVVPELCTAPNALQSTTVAAMLERWFRLLPEYTMPRSVLEQRPGKAEAFANLSSASTLLLQTRVLEVCVSARMLSEARAMAVATHFGRAAGAFFAFEQACRMPERSSQKRLCGLLRACCGEPLEHGHAAGEIYLGSPEV